MMPAHERFALNRIACPSLSLPAFLDFAKGAGLTKVELRNDIRDGSVLDGLAPGAVAAMLAERGVQVITINALQHFNLASQRVKAEKELTELLATAKAISCPALVLCPHNDPSDTRSQEARFSETVAALRAFGPAFEATGIMGFVEPLGFGISSLSSLETALEAIKASGFGCYGLLIDTFHYHIGPDAEAGLRTVAASGLTGLVHVSGVADSLPVAEFRDGHRIMPGPGDVMKSGETIRVLVESGYKGDISFEPFSAQVQALPVDALRREISEGMEWLSRSAGM
jgi:2-keto-myo-inositol isomerase